MRRGKLSYRCSVCQHPERLTIDRQLVQGIRKTTLAERYGVSTAALLNHEREHISRQLAQGIEKQQALQNMNLHEELVGTYNRVKRILDQAERDGKPYLALEAAAEMRQSMGLMLKCAVELQQMELIKLQIEQEKSGEATKDRQAEWTSKMWVLSDAELLMYERICQKIDGGLKTVILPDPPKETFPPYHHQEPIEEDGESSEPEPGGEGELRPGPVQPRTIPG